MLYIRFGYRKTEVKHDGTSKTVTCYTKSDLIKSDGTCNYNYDNNGNMVDKGKNAAAKTNGGLFEGWTFKSTTGEVWKYEYDLCNRLTKVKHSNTGTNNLIQVAEYKYDFRGLMVCRTTGTGSSAMSEYFAYDNEGKLIYTEKGSAKHDYIYANGKIWCEIVTSGNTKNTYYHHTDHLGTTVCITNTSGSVVWECEEDAFGKEKDKTNSSFTPNFTGKLLDLNTGLYYFNARWYDPDMGRFITEDPARDGRNWFVYCRNNPLIFIDVIGFAPRNISEEDRKLYKAEISRFKDYHYETNKMGIPDEYDCADLATYLYGQATSKTSLGNMISSLKHNDISIDKENLADTVSSSDFFPENIENISFYEGTDFNNPNIETGSVAVWKAEENETWVGHIATIVDVERNKNGDVTKIVTIEGHINNHTSVDNTNTSAAVWKTYKGTFLGFGEIGRDSTKKRDE